MAGDKTGSTCKIEDSTLISPQHDLIILNASIENDTLPKLFNKGIGVFGYGIYAWPTSECSLSGEIKWELNGTTNTINLPEILLTHNAWNRSGLIIELPLDKDSNRLARIDLNLQFKTASDVNIYGLISGSLKHEYFESNDVHTAFREKQNIYIPEMLYYDPTDRSISPTIIKGTMRGVGKPIVCKSCNRCSRYLPIDIENERNTLGYSNHCVSRAPCTHQGFSRYKIMVKGSRKIKAKIEDDCIVSHFGHQLGCKACKKFFVNLPLNPLRDSTQHREDSLRRRALEVLVAELLGSNWAYHEHRIKTGKEFDTTIWNKFNKKCFNCGTALKSPNEMDLDHTLPLAYLWPLDNTATCLCGSCNSSKSDKFPVDFYSAEQLEALARITGLKLEDLQARKINKDAADKLLERVKWFFDTFLKNKDYQKIRKGKKAADLIVQALHNVLNSGGYKTDLIHLYKQAVGAYPKTVSIE